jgi:CelD/BcsL family acetyltransferase involved in cellulose biosynthesis
MNAITTAYPRFRPTYLVAHDGPELAGLIPLVTKTRLGVEQYISMPFGSHGGPLLAPGADPAVAAALAEGFRGLGMRLRTMRFEMSVFDPPGGLREALRPALGSTFHDFRTHIVDLSPGFDELWESGYRRGTRKCVRAARRAGVEVQVEEPAVAIDVLHRLHSEQSQEWMGIHPHPREVIESLIESYREDARIYVARAGEKPLAACLFLHHQGKEVHPWVSGATPEGRESRAFHLLIHDAMRDACETGFTFWNFGGSGGNPDIEFFKESFAATPRPVLRCFHMPVWARRLRKQPAWDR